MAFFKKLGEFVTGTLEPVAGTITTTAKAIEFQAKSFLDESKLDYVEELAKREISDKTLKAFEANKKLLASIE